MHEFMRLGLRVTRPCVIDHMIAIGQADSDVTPILEYFRYSIKSDKNYSTHQNFGGTETYS